MAMTPTPTSPALSQASPSITLPPPELQTAYAAVSAIQTEYQPQIMLGLTKDPAAAQALVDEYYQKAEAAGLETVRQAVKDQLQAFLDNRNA